MEECGSGAGYWTRLHSSNIRPLIRVPEIHLRNIRTLDQRVHFRSDSRCEPNLIDDDELIKGPLTASRPSAYDPLLKIISF